MFTNQTTSYCTDSSNTINTTELSSNALNYTSTDDESMDTTLHQQTPPSYDQEEEEEEEQQRKHHYDNDIYDISVVSGAQELLCSVVSVSEQDMDVDNELARLYLNETDLNSSDEQQTIMDLVHASGEEHSLAGHNGSIRVAFGIILRLVLPLANGLVRGIQGIRDVRFLRVLRNITASRQALTNLLAFAANTISMNLSSVQVTHRLEPLLKLLKLRRTRDGVESLPDTSNSGSSTPMTPGTPTSPTPPYSPLFREPTAALPPFSVSKRKMTLTVQEAAPKCCTLNVLAEPPPGKPIRADIIFIHGLHGSLVNTWKQGLWENERKPVEFERPPKPPVRPPKRPRHSRIPITRPPHKQKRARFAHAELSKQSSERDKHEECDEQQVHGQGTGIAHANGNGNSFSYVCGEPKDIQMCDGIEYSFPTFRLRMHDNGRLLQSEIESILNDENAHKGSKEQTLPNKKTKKCNVPRASLDDPNYSKCWPGDWLPLDCPGVRVIALNYTTDQYLWRPLWKKKEPRTNLIQRAREMAELLIEQRVGCGHPIIWVGHSKGGLFVKQIIVDAWESGRLAMAPFWRSSRGCFFYSVPHRGSHLASIKAPLLTRSVELIDIEKNSKYLLDLHRRFVGLYYLGHLKIDVFSFVETALTLMSVLYLRIVGADSADPGIGDVCGIRLDHREICKPRSRDCILYKELVKMINKVC